MLHNEQNLSEDREQDKQFAIVRQHSFLGSKEKLKLQAVHTEDDVQAEQFVGHTKHIPFNKYFP